MSRPTVCDVRHRGGDPIPRAAPARLCRGQRVYDQGPAHPLIPHVARRERERRLPHRERRRLARCTDGYGLCHRRSARCRPRRGHAAARIESRRRDAQNGGYPYYLKQRILSEYGHLSNDAAAEFAIECVRAGTSDILLAHLSDENNSPQLAEYTVGRALQSSGLSVRLAAAPRDTISEVHVCRRSPSFASEN